jgi:tetratricopeptide (TPR) repeat protein
MGRLSWNGSEQISGNQLAAAEKVQPTGASAKKPPAAAAKIEPAPLVLDDTPQPLAHEQRAGEREKDRAEALSLFATARVREQREDYASALRGFQRALRCDPRSGAILEGIVDTASQLHREAEVSRYARKAVEVESGDELLLSRLALRLTEQGDWESAAAVYEKVLASRGKEPESATEILLRLELGKLYHLLDKYPQGADCFVHVQKALENPKDYGIDEKFRKEMLSDPGALYNVIGECNLLADRPAAARAAFEKAHALAPDKEFLGLNLARVQLKEKHPVEALTSLQPYFAAKLAKEGMLPYRVLSDALAALNRSGEVISRLEKLHADDPANVPLGYFLAAEYRQAKQLDKAEQLYSELLKKSPTSFGYRGLIDIDRRNKRFDDLLAVLGSAAVKLSSLEPLAGEIKDLAGDGPVFDRLVDAARKQVRADPKTPDYGVRLVLALLAVERKQYDVAGEFYQLAAESRPDRRAEILLQWGVTLLTLEKRADAAKVFRQGLEKAAPEIQSVMTYYLVGALAADKHYDEALALARKALEQEKDSPRMAVREGWVLFLAKRYEEARQKLTALVKRLDNDYHSQEIRLAVREAKLLLSNLETSLKQPVRAEEWLEQVLDEFPDDASALNDLGYLWTERGVHLERALRMAQKAVQDEPDNSAYRDSLGWAYYRLGRFKQAVVELEKANAGDQPEGMTLDHLGDAYQQAGQPQKARDAWQRALKQLRSEGDRENVPVVEKKLNKRETE